MPFAPSANEARRVPRETVHCPSRIWSATLAPIPALIVNISPHGCMMRSDQIVRIGDSLTVEMPVVGSLRGFVIWSLGARIGIEFDAPVPIESYLAMLAGMKSSAGDAGPLADRDR